MTNGPLDKATATNESWNAIVDKIINPTPPAPVRMHLRGSIEKETFEAKDSLGNSFAISNGGLPDISCDGVSQIVNKDNYDALGINITGSLKNTFGSFGTHAPSTEQDAGLLGALVAIGKPTSADMNFVFETGPTPVGIACNVLKAMDIITPLTPSK